MKSKNKNSANRRVLAGFLWVSFFVFIGKFAGAAKEMAIAWRYGVSETVDAYVLLYSILSWPIAVWLSVLTIVLVPLVARLRVNSETDLNQFKGELFGLSLLLGVIVGGASWGVSQWAISSGYISVSEEVLLRALEMVGPLSLKVPLGFVACFFSAWLMAWGKHRNTLLEALPALIILTFVLLPPGVVPAPLVWGTVAGVALQSAGLLFALGAQQKVTRPRLSFKSTAWVSFWSAIGVMVFGQALAGLTGVVDQLFAADLGAGSISVLNYANRVLALFSGMAALAISRATLPVFAEANVGTHGAAHTMGLRWAILVFFSVAVISVLVFYFSKELVGLIFERGAFGSDDTQEVALLFRVAILQLPFYCSALVLVSVLGASRRYSLIALSGATNLLFKIAFAVPLVEAMQLTGLVLSTVAMYAVSLVVLFVFVRIDKKSKECATQG